MRRAASPLHRAIRMLTVLGATAGMLLAATGTADASAGQWPLDASHFQAERIWALSKGAGVTVAVVDSGVEAAHPDLAGQVLPGTSLLGDGADGRTDTSSDSHGTAIAALIAGTGASSHGKGITGLAPAAKILPVRVTTTSEVTPSLLAQGITWAADHGAQVINVSMGEPDPDPLLKQAVDYAMSKNAVVVASAGNDGQSGNEIMYPAGFPGVVAVSGTDQNNAFWPTSESGPDITVAAPASQIASASDTGQYVEADGTSYAAGYVSAAFALIRSRYPSLTAGQAIRRLIATTGQHANAPSAEMGYGEIDPLAALTSDISAGASTNPLLAPRPATPSPSGTTITWTIAAGILAAILLGLTGWLLVRRNSTGPTRKAPARTTAAPPRPPASGNRRTNTKQQPRAKSPTRSR